MRDKLFVRQVLFVVLSFCVFLFWGAVQTPVFLAIYGGSGDTSISAGDYFEALWAGLPLCSAVAAYFTAPLLIAAAVAQCLGRAAWLRPAVKAYDAVAALVISLSGVCDLVLYKYWGFRLDATPLFYLLTSPSAAFASVTAEMAVIGVAAVLLVAAAVWYSLQWPVEFLRGSFAGRYKPRWWMPVAMLAVGGGALFVTMRGGFTVATMNVSRAYYSPHTILNHAATNPLFNFLYSVTHQDDFKSQFRLLDADDAAATFTASMAPAPETDQVSASGGAPVLKYDDARKPDIYIVILESFSAHLMPSLGGAPVALHLDSLAREGVSFGEFYANGFRTDRGIPAILSGFPGAPTASVMKYIPKASHLPSLASHLAAAGYETAYYYGGDINFTNMGAYLRNTGFACIVSDADFPLSQKASKWGADDRNLLALVSRRLEIRKPSDAPGLHVIQTSSSHEPFEVDFRGRFADPRRNAFEYTDTEVGRFVGRVRALQGDRPWLMVLVADHYGAWPETVTAPLARHRIPMVWTGTALSARGLRVDIPASQADIAPTLLSALGIPGAADFKFGRDIFSSGGRGGVFISQPGFYGWIERDGYSVIDTQSGRITASRGADTSLYEKRAKAYIQTLYDYLDSL